MWVHLVGFYFKSEFFNHMNCKLPIGSMYQNPNSPLAEIVGVCLLIVESSVDQKNKLINAISCVLHCTEPWLPLHSTENMAGHRAAVCLCLVLLFPDGMTICRPLQNQPWARPDFGTQFLTCNNWRTLFEWLNPLCDKENCVHHTIVKIGHLQCICLDYSSAIWTSLLFCKWADDQA